MKNLVTVTQTVKVLLLLLIVISPLVKAEKLSYSIGNWEVKKFDRSKLKRYDFNNTKEALLSNIKKDFKENPYIRRVESLDITNVSDEISVFDAWVDQTNEGNSVFYLMFTIRQVADIYAVYVVKNNQIIDKYFVSSWGGREVESKLRSRKHINGVIDD